MPSLRQYVALLRQMGPGWLAYRAGYAARRRFGLLKRASPIASWEQLPAPELELHPLSLIQPVPASWGTACIGEADAVLRGEFKLFSYRVVSAGFTPDWHANQLAEGQPSQCFDEASGERNSGLRSQASGLQPHWSEISDFRGGDIKGVWELSRFPWAFALARAYGRTGDMRYADAFWRLFFDWCEKNPPNAGPNWMCGQEATFRLMAVVFAAEACGIPEKQRDGLVRFIVATGQRIAANLDYALSQKNNHGVSECVGLITTALLVPEFAESADWLARGLRELEAQLAELVYEDGGFSQHSLIYHRVLLHDLCWCRRRLTAAGRTSPAWLDAAGRRALDFLMRLVDPVTGQAPLYGANDGANVLPLAETGFLDMRPVVQMAAAVHRSELPLPEGPWDEAAAWLVPEWSALKRVPWPVVPARWYARAAGCFQLTDGADRLFLRCPENFRHRPGQADMLHVDITHAGRPVASDGGSFSYNSPERFTVLGQAAHHNVLTVDGREPLEKFNRFLYLPWPKGEASAEEPGGFRASHDGYAALGVKWTRTVSQREGGGWLVRDRVTGAGGRALQWHWRLANRPWSVAGDSVAVADDAGRYRISWRSSIPAKVSLVRADAASAYGWWSPHYGKTEPACALRLEVRAPGEVDLTTEFFVPVAASPNNQ